MKRWLLPMFAIVMFSGCANYQTMALKKGQGALSTSTHSVVLMTLEVLRPDGSRYQPKPSLVIVSQKQADDRDQATLFRLNWKEDLVQRDGGTVYLASMALLPGHYRIDGISGIANAFPFIGQFFIPVLADFEVAPVSVSYLGHLKATMRERRKGEFRAGSTIPLIDQSATGMISHTWDVEIDDRHDADLATFRQQVPALVDLAVQSNPLPAWDRAAAQRLWDGMAQPEVPADVDAAASTESVRP